MRVVFLGTPDFGVNALKEINKRHEVVAVITQPDRARDRGKEVKPCPIKVCASELGLPVLQYERISREGVEDLKSLAPDIMVTAAYGQILSDEVLAIAKHGIINIHASLLPKYRGAAPIQWAIINGEKKTGVTIMQTAHGVDTGDIILQEEIGIGAKETSAMLFERLSVLGAECVVKALELIESGKATFTKQDESKATKCRMFVKSDGKLNFIDSAENIINRVRAIPCYFTIDSKQYKVFDVDKVDSNVGVAGTVIEGDKRLLIAVLDGTVEIKEIQAEGGKRMNTASYLLGHKFTVGAKVDE